MRLPRPRGNARCACARVMMQHRRFLRNACNGERDMSETLTVDVSNENWEREVIRSDIPVLVDFWAQWCGPCKALAPVLDELATELSGRVKIAKVNVDSNSDLAQKFNIRSIPTLLVFKAGAVREQMTGGAAKAELKARLAEHMP